jgi:hypothetical protein
MTCGELKEYFCALRDFAAQLTGIRRYDSMQNASAGRFFDIVVWVGVL